MASSSQDLDEGDGGARLVCFARCGGWAEGGSPFEVVYHCPACGGLLEVEHDVERLREAGDGRAWRTRFDARLRRAAWAGSGGWGGGVSGVWGKREWVLPEVGEERVVSLYEGATPLLAAEGIARQSGADDRSGGKLWIKQCGHAHTGSFKDLGMTVLVSAVNEMIHRGVGVRAVACASTGDTSAALAAYCARAGIPAVVLLPAGKISTAQLIQPVANGALVLALQTDFDGCMEVVRGLTEERGSGIYLANSLNSLRIEGQKTVGIEIVQQLGWTVPDWIVIPGGNLGNVSALAKGLSLALALGVIDRLPRICVAQVSAADPLFRAYKEGWPEGGLDEVTMVAGETQASAIRIGAPVSYDKAVAALKATDGVVRTVGEEELADTAALADRTGMFTCPHTAVALAAWRQLVDEGDVGPGDRSVVVSTASGLKFPEFKVRYHEGGGERANRPVDCEASVDAVREAVERRLAGASTR